MKIKCSTSEAPAPLTYVPASSIREDGVYESSSTTGLTYIRACGRWIGFADKYNEWTFFTGENPSPSNHLRPSNRSITLTFGA